MILFKPVFPQIISPRNPFSHATFTNIRRNQGFSERTVGNADLTCSLFPLNCRNPSDLNLSDQLTERSKIFLLGFMMPIPCCLWHSGLHRWSAAFCGHSSCISRGRGGGCGLLPLSTPRGKGWQPGPSGRGVPSTTLKPPRLEESHSRHSGVLTASTTSWARNGVVRPLNLPWSYAKSKNTIRAGYDYENARYM